ncbi:MAG: apolipoprotein N-acyltransferase [Candidatus Anammoxibacter sp.]
MTALGQQIEHAKPNRTLLGKMGRREIFPTTRLTFVTRFLYSVHSTNRLNYNALNNNINKFLSSQTCCKAPIILSSFTILFLTLSFPIIDQGYMIWFALAPWLVLLKKNSRPVLSSLFVGSLFFLINLAWLRHVTYPAWILLSAYSMCYFVLFGLCTSFIVKRCRLPLTIIAPFLWVSLEYVRSFLLTGFPWLFLGHTQYQYLPIIQISDITGLYGISFLVVLVNAGIAECVTLPDLHSTSNYKQQRISRYLLNIAFPVVLLIIVTIYGFFCLKRNVPENGNSLNVSVVQGNILQSVKNNPDEIQQIDNLQRYVNLSLLTADEPEKVDLIIWPETMAPGILNIDPTLTGRNIDMVSQLSIQNLAYMLDTCLLIGGTAIEINKNEQTFYNSAFFYDEKGAIVDRYDKIHLVPFGEYTPLRRYFPFLARLVPYEVDLSHGKERVIFERHKTEGQRPKSKDKRQKTEDRRPEIGGYRFGVLICYEDTMPNLVRKFANEGVDFMVNITNDGWFRKSAELDQHLAIMVFRAIENRTTIIRAANTGISAFIDSNGVIYDRLQNDHGEYKEIDGVLTNKVTINKESAKSWYTENGDIFAFFCVFASCVLLFIAAKSSFS